MLSADGDLTGYENLLISAKLYGIPRAERTRRIAQALEFMELSHVGNKLVHQYSGGRSGDWKLRNQIECTGQACCFSTSHRSASIPRPSATSGGNSVLRREFGTTILMTTHDMEEADHLCDLVAVMHRGVLAVMDTPAALKEKVGSAATLDDVFIHFTGSTISEGGDLRDVSRTRLTSQRLG